MGIRSLLAKPLAAYIVEKTKRKSFQAVLCQRKTLTSLLRKGAHTRFGKDHHFHSIKNYEDFKKHVPVRNYERLRPYFEATLKGEKDVLWPGCPLYVSKTSGTTSGVKYIPITKDSMPNHIQGARDALLHYVHETGNTNVLDTQWIFLSGSPALEKKGTLRVGRLSGIVNHHVPRFLRSNQMPSYATNCIADWEDKLDHIIAETLKENMGIISGIPPWVQMYFDRIRDKTGKTVKEVFPNFSLFIYGGVNFSPYRAKLFESIGSVVDSIELYPASEGFIAYQDKQCEEGLLLLVNSGMFFEFIPAEEYFNEHPVRISIEHVQLGVNYALIINSNAGLWGYSIGDTVRFVSLNPYRILVTGRISHFISAFGEHVIGEEVEQAMQRTMKSFPEAQVIEFTVAPQVSPAKGLPYHEWLVAFRAVPHDLFRFAQQLDEQLRLLNIYYDDLISGGILRTLTITPLKSDAFIRYMKSQGKLGGQNKVPRLANDRSIADRLTPFAVVETDVDGECRDPT